jgi:conflict system pore-forming effector with SLATT domain/uncharacterized protein DUF5670
MSSQPPITPPVNPNPAATPNPPVTPVPAVNPPAETPATHRVRSATFWIIVVALLILWLVGWRWSGCGLWIHLLLVLALAAVLVELLSRGGNSKNIDAEREHIPNWNPAEPEVSLTQIYIYVLDEAAKSTKWYWKNKGSKATLSRVIRFAVWALAAVGGLLPIIGALLEDHFPNLDLTNGLWASLLLGIAAALLGLDKGFGFSSGWARYVLTATNIRKSLEEFRLDWTVLRAKAGSSLTAETVAPLIERAKQFRSDVEGLVLQETKDWVTEFQSTMQQMEKDVAAQISNLKAQVDKTIQEKEAASKPGFVQLTIKDPNNKFANANLKVTLIDSNNQAVQGVQQQPVTNLVWPSPFVPPGTYQLKVEGTVNNVQFSQTRSVTVKSGEMATPSAPDITL